MPSLIKRWFQIVSIMLFIITYIFKTCLCKLHTIYLKKCQTPEQRGYSAKISKIRVSRLTAIILWYAVAKILLHIWNRHIVTCDLYLMMAHKRDSIDFFENSFFSKYVNMAFKEVKEYLILAKFRNDRVKLWIFYVVFYWTVLNYKFTIIFLM